MDINQIPLGAPLSFEEPSKAWRDQQNKAGLSRETLSVPDADLTGKWIIVVGANSGIGREATLQFAKWGANIILGCRSPPPYEPHPDQVVKECQEAAKAHGHHNTTFEWWETDYSKLDSVEAFAQRWLDTGRPLDVLCNNAGIGGTPNGADLFKTSDGFEIHHQVNFLSHVLCTLRLLPALARAPQPRVTCTVSSMQFNGDFDLRNCNGEIKLPSRDGAHFYSNNKLWFQVWLTEMQRRLLQNDQYKHIIINGVHPGWVNSEIWNLKLEGLMGLLKITAFRLATRLMAINSQQGSLCILKGVTGMSEGGKYVSRTTIAEPMPHAKDPDCRQRVWRKVNEELKLQEKGLLDVLGLDYVEETNYETRARL
ncbi:WW domain-containing oxidoreductase [Microthyrium microscopicum]|uniref:WW domain-containing oxidoreductase n=1 Tax=Microthyrium microscopicum TaxID=703497 RepID=A0A6A6U5L7_9PEZI|nr:WW domain-containing oxidoreductase [Microthyrium microscopicum]